MEIVEKIINLVKVLGLNLKIAGGAVAVVDGLFKEKGKSKTIVICY